MLSLAGLLLIVLIMVVLLKSKMSPVTALIILPTIAAFFVGASIKEVGEMAVDGVKGVSNNAFLFIFSIIFFSVMSDVGVFDIIVDRLVAWAGTNVISILVATSIVAIIAHLDGATATTVLITVPTMYPIFKRMHIDPKMLLCLTGAGMGVMNLLPWGGPVARAATVLGSDATELWLQLIPIQIVGVVCQIGLAVFFGMKAKKEGAGASLEVSVEDKEKTALSDRHRKLLPVNVLLTIGVIALLMFNVFPSYYVFMLALSVALMINYPTLKEQNGKIAEHAKSALPITATILAAGIMVGIMGGTGMIEALANSLTNIIPSFLGRYIHVIFGLLALPMGMVMGTDAYFFGLMPPIIAAAESFGLEGVNVAMTMLIGKNISLMISPLVPATYLALGLVPEANLTEHIKFSFKYLYLISVIMLLAGFLLGVVHL